MLLRKIVYIMLSEISQSQKGKYCKYEVPRTVKFKETERRMVVARGWGRRKRMGVIV